MTKNFQKKISFVLSLTPTAAKWPPFLHSPASEPHECFLTPDIFDAPPSPPGTNVILSTIHPLVHRYAAAKEKTWPPHKPQYNAVQVG